MRKGAPGTSSDTTSTGSPGLQLGRIDGAIVAFDVSMGVKAVAQQGVVGVADAQFAALQPKVAPQHDAAHHRQVVLRAGGSAEKQECEYGSHLVYSTTG